MTASKDDKGNTVRFSKWQYTSHSGGARCHCLQSGRSRLLPWKWRQNFFLPGWPTRRHIPEDWHNITL